MLKLSPILAVCFLTLNFTSLFAEEVSVKLPPKIEKVVQVTKATILKNYQSEIDKLSKELEKSKIIATKAGNLNDAIIVDNLIKEISNDSLLTEIIKDNKKKSESDLLGNPLQNDKNIMIGIWKFNINGSHLLDITFDGKKGVSSNTQSFNYTFKNGNLEIIWIGGGTWNLKLDTNTRKFTGKDSGGATVEAGQ